MDFHFHIFFCSLLLKQKMLDAARENLRMKNKVDPFPFYLNPAILTATTTTTKTEQTKT